MDCMSDGLRIAEKVVRAIFSFAFLSAVFIPAGEELEVTYAADLPVKFNKSHLPMISIAGKTMGTSYHIKFFGLRPVPIQNEIDSLLEDINNEMSTYISSSTLSRFNLDKKKFVWFPISKELLGVVTVAKRIHQMTNKAFEPTIGPLVNIWGFGPDKKPDAIPRDNQINGALELVDFSQIETRADPPALRKSQAGMYLDLSAIAKGYAVDKVAEYLESLGLNQYMVEIGGELRIGRLKPSTDHGDGRWAIGVETPEASLFRNDAKISQVLRLHSVSMATSGDYRNYFEQNGSRYSHIIDPRSGRPIKHKLASVTVLSGTCAEADAMATAFMVLGTDKALKIADQHGIAALFIQREGKQFVSKVSHAMKEFIN